MKEIKIPTREEIIRRRENALKVAVEELSADILERFQTAYNDFSEHLDSRFFFQYCFTDVSGVAGFTANRVVHQAIISVFSTLIEGDHNWTFSFEIAKQWQGITPNEFDSFKEDIFKVDAICIRESFS